MTGPEPRKLGAFRVGPPSNWHVEYTWGNDSSRYDMNYGGRHIKMSWMAFRGDSVEVGDEREGEGPSWNGWNGWVGATDRPSFTNKQTNKKNIYVYMGYRGGKRKSNVYSWMSIPFHIQTLIDATYNHIDPRRDPVLFRHAAAVLTSFRCFLFLSIRLAVFALIT